jgi:hypothetical protein
MFKFGRGMEWTMSAANDQQALTSKIGRDKLLLVQGYRSLRGRAALPRLSQKYLRRFFHEA